MARRGVSYLPSKAMYRKHLIRVVVLQDAADRDDGLLVLIEPPGRVHMVQALWMGRVTVAGREVDCHLFDQIRGQHVTSLRV